jgi:hypothetical protein
MEFFFNAMLIACKCTPLCKKLDYNVKNEPPYFVATHLHGFMVCNIDDIFIFSKNMEEHECHVCLVLDKLEEVKCYAILKKCEFYQTKVEFLGYIILKNDICMVYGSSHNELGYPNLCS